MICKFFTNVLLVKNENIGINGAAIGNIICNMIVCIIGFNVLIRNINLKINYKSFILKPLFATIVMGLVAICLNFFLKGIILEKNLNALSIGCATMVYGVLIIILKIVKKY